MNLATRGLLPLHLQTVIVGHQQIVLIFYLLFVVAEQVQRVLSLIQNLHEALVNILVILKLLLEYLVPQLLLNPLISDFLIDGYRVIYQGLTQVLHDGHELLLLLQWSQQIIGRVPCLDPLTPVERWIAIRSLVLLDLKAHQYRDSCRTLHGLAAGGHNPDDPASLVCRQINIVGDLLIVLDELLPDDGFLLVFGLAGLQNSRNRCYLLQEVRFGVEVVLLHLGHLAQDELHENFGLDVEVLGDGQRHLALRLGVYVALDPAEPNDVVGDARQGLRLFDQELLELEVRVPSQGLEELGEVENRDLRGTGVKGLEGHRIQEMMPRILVADEVDHTTHVLIPPERQYLPKRGLILYALEAHRTPHQNI